MSSSLYNIYLYRTRVVGVLQAHHYSVQSPFNYYPGLYRCDAILYNSQGNIKRVPTNSTGVSARYSLHPRNSYLYNQLYSCITTCDTLCNASSTASHDPFYHGHGGLIVQDVTIQVQKHAAECAGRYYRYNINCLQ
ncbi:hypothetical protein K474DRAFT_1670744 [Panus rudis PR-1116 ss-1]|nr:hypothetical protein K474DRAFT_1670744 [Panus rudis PR-1116 ss-1]